MRGLIISVYTLERGWDEGVVLDSWIAVRYAAVPAITKPAWGIDAVYIMTLGAIK